MSVIGTYPASWSRSLSVLQLVAHVLEYRRIERRHEAHHVFEPVFYRGEAHLVGALVVLGDAMAAHPDRHRTGERRAGNAGRLSGELRGNPIQQLSSVPRLVIGQLICGMHARPPGAWRAARCTAR